jgi:hypothetical protein
VNLVVFVELESLYSNVRAHPFIGSRGARTLSGIPTGGPDDILNNVHIEALNGTDSEIFLFGPVRILYQGMVMCRLASTGFAVSDMRSGRRAVTVCRVSSR